MYLLDRVKHKKTLTAREDLLVHHDIVHVYNEFCGGTPEEKEEAKKQKKQGSEGMAACISNVPLNSYEDMPEANLRTLIEKPPIGGKVFERIGEQLLHAGFTLEPGYVVDDPTYAGYRRDSEQLREDIGVTGESSEAMQDQYFLPRDIPGAIEEGKEGGAFAYHTPGGESGTGTTSSTVLQHQASKKSKKEKKSKKHHHENGSSSGEKKKKKKHKRDHSQEEEPHYHHHH
eukprot:Nk52_evm2s298 gene=Nk52_evmTU2s298